MGEEVEDTKKCVNFYLSSTLFPPCPNRCSMDAQRVLNGCMYQPEHPFIPISVQEMNYFE